MSRAAPAWDDEEDEVLADLNRADELLREGGIAMGELVGGEFNFDETAIIPFNLSVTQDIDLNDV